MVVYEPNPHGDRPVNSRVSQAPQRTVGRAALITLMERYLRGLLDPFITRLEVLKLLYFLQHAGEPLRLRFTKGTFGPYAENLRHVLVAIEGHLISGDADGGDSPSQPLTLVPGATSKAEQFLSHHHETRVRLERVATLVEGFESSFGLELLSTVHWVHNQEPRATPEQLIARTYAWGKRKQQFSRRQIQL
ncbi:MAG: Appr-1-p processing protein, partial [Planctomycetaceae bacterium]